MGLISLKSCNYLFVEHSIVVSGNKSTINLIRLEQSNQRYPLTFTLNNCIAVGEKPIGVKLSKKKLCVCLCVFVYLSAVCSNSNYMSIVTKYHIHQTVRWVGSVK